MGISVADNFDHKSKKPLDARTSYATTALMKAVTDANMNEGCFAYCEETDKYYKFLSSNTVDETLGKWREWAGGGGGTSDYSDLSNKPSINNVTLSGNKTTSDLGISYDDLSNKPTIPSVSNCYKTDDSAETTLADGDYFPFYDASASGMRKSLWSNIKSVLKTYFDTLYSTVKESLSASSGSSTLSLVTRGEKYTWGQKQDKLTAGNNVSISGSTISANASGSLVNNYTTSEQVIGTWIDGSTLYQRTFTGTTSNSSDIMNIATLQGIKVRNMFGIISSTSSDIATSTSQVLLPVGASKSAGFSDDVNIFAYADNGTITLFYGSGMNTYRNKGYALTVQYTKTS